MFDFNKIKMKPSYVDGYIKPATDAQIAELEQYCKHPLPESFKIILKNYNGGQPEAKNFDVKEGNVFVQCHLYNFYWLDADKQSPGNIWWLIENYGDLMGPQTVPFAEDRIEQIYFFKWINNKPEPEIWYLEYLDLDEPETTLVANSFDNLLNSLYVS